MKHELTVKDIILNARDEKVFTRNIVRLEKKLHNFAIDMPELTIMLKHHEKNHFISGTVSLILPKKKLVVKVGNHEVREVLHEAFETLDKAFETYKAKHFKGSSKHPSQTSIKGDHNRKSRL